MPSSPRLALLLTMTAACGFPRPTDVGDDDVQDPPRVIVQVAGTGDDANDGFTKPVKTLKHAIGIAAANHDVTDIVLASGRYSTAGGETFPYTVPANVTVSGPVGGGAILAGSKAEPGMVVDIGNLEDLELEDFTIAVTATGNAQLAGLRIRTNMVAIRAEAAAELTLDNVDITGAVGACATGIVLNGAAELQAAGLATRNLGTSLDAKDQSVSTVQSANIAGDRACAQPVMTIATSRMLTVRDSIIDGGNNGIALFPRASTLHATIANTIVRNLKNNAIAGGLNAGGAAVLEMIGGELSSNGQGGAELAGGTWSFTNVSLKQNPAFGVYLQDGTLTMRGCQMTGNGEGVSLIGPGAVDLGTVADPGNNTFQSNSIGLDYVSGNVQVEAVGNTWNRTIQGTNDLGRYLTPAVIAGHVSYALGNNYAIGCDAGQCTLHR